MLSKSICCEQQLLRSRRNAGARPAATSHTSLHKAISSILQMKPCHKNSSGLFTVLVAQMQKEMETECPPDKLASRKLGQPLGTVAAGCSPRQDRGHQPCSRTGCKRAAANSSCLCRSYTMQIHCTASAIKATTNKKAVRLYSGRILVVRSI